MAKVSAKDVFAESIERETHVRLSPDALHRVILRLCSNVLEPEHLKAVTMISEVARAILLKTVVITAPQGTALFATQVRRQAQAEADIEAAAATMIREIATRRLISEAYAHLTAEWKNEAGTPVVPPTASEWVALRNDFTQFQADTLAKIAAYESKQDDELIVTTQTVSCEACEGQGKRMGIRCYDCEGMGTRSIEVARNRPIPTPEPEVAAGRAWERLVMDTGFNPGTQRGAYVAGYMAGIRSTEE